MRSGKLTWTTVLEIVGIFSIVGSLIFVGLQMKQDREIAAAENVMLVLSEREVWAELIAANGNIWIKGNSGAELTPEEDLAYMALAEVLNLRYFASWFRGQRVPGANPPETFAYEWAVIVNENPGLMRFWQDMVSRQDHTYGQLGIEQAVSWRQTVNDYIADIAEDK